MIQIRTARPTPAALCALLLAPALSLLAATSGTAAAQGYGPDTCKSGFVWREAIPSDHVCVRPSVRDQTAYDNRQAAYRRNPNGAYGSNTCLNGFVWREAFSGDAVCVTPDVREQAQRDNARAASRRAQ